ncbi:MAG: Nramp family divalent metal transporter [Synergistaceae bacterium]|nr:Nramp family divalent metal transporter [Synergistaceae bacterium]
MSRLNSFRSFLRGREPQPRAALEFLRYIGPGILVTVGFIDPGNWAANVAAGSGFGYSLLWIVTLSTLMLILLQHNAAHLGIATGLCLSEAATEHLPAWLSRTLQVSALGAAASTALAEILGAAIALELLFHLPLPLGGVLATAFSLWALLTNSYRKLEKWIIAFVSLIGLSFLFELSLVKVPWTMALRGWVVPAVPEGSMLIVMSVLGAVVMPHNLFLHSEVIQSREWHLLDESAIRKQLRYEWMDTIFSMGIGWAINSAMILLSAATFFSAGIRVTELGQAQSLLRPLLGNAAALVFCLALLFSGLSSSVTAGMAGGSIMAGIFREPYNIRDRHSRFGVFLTLGLGCLILFFVKDPFSGLIYSQMLLSVQLPVTIVCQILLTSSRKVMGRFANSVLDNALLWGIALVVTALNLILLFS